jgi:UDP-2,3-diacylglucosamine pyrophosphatase LpxH
MSNKIRSLFISDVHLGSSKSQTDKLLLLLKSYEFENLFIIGDFLDLTSLKRNFFWKNEHSIVIQKILRLSRKGVNIVYILGNHDFYLRDILHDGAIKLGDILICDEFIWQTQKGKLIYLTHGDCFDGFIRMNKVLYNFGDWTYELSMKINILYNSVRKWMGLDYWSLSAYLKMKVKNVVKFLTQYRKMSEIKLKEKKCDILMMGHIHTPEMTDNYINTGDFCESCSYVIEDQEGNLQLLFIK